MSNPLWVMLSYCGFKGEDYYLVNYDEFVVTTNFPKMSKYPVFPNRQDSRRKHDLVLELI
jgi:hypothetical protein